MEHLFVPYALALTLKEKGFDEPSLTYYKSGQLQLLSWNFDDDTFNKFSSRSKKWVSAPLYQQVVDWFREKYDLHISVASMGLGYVGQHNNTPVPHTWDIDKRWDGEPTKDYYEALTAAITHALKLI